MSDSIPFVGDFYDVLGVARDASTEEIKKAFRKLARECHPDVAGDDPKAAERFNRIRKAYEILVDPTERARYDRRGQKRTRWSPEGFRMPGGFHYRTGREGPDANSGRRGRASSKLDLEDIFNDFGNVGDFGFGAGAAGRGGRHGPGQATARQPGRDITMTVDVPARTAERGGTITLRYPRMRRSSDGGALYRYDEIYDLRVAPGTTHGATLRVPRMGDAATDGGADGDLVCDIRLVPDADGPRAGRSGTAEDRPHPGRQAPPPAAEPPPEPEPEPQAEPEAEPEVKVVPISVGEALLGARIPVDTPAGRLRVTIPACTSSGTRMRLKGKGAGGADLHVELRIVTPRSLDEEGRELIEAFAELYPYDPREWE